MRILIVDDSRHVRNLASRMLKKLGHEAEVAEHGKHCLEILEWDSGFDVVLMDWNMPEMDGLDALKAIKADESLSLIKVVMLTTENTPEKIQSALQNGADEYIMKPFNEDILSEKLNSLNDSLF